MTAFLDILFSKFHAILEGLDVKAKNFRHDPREESERLKTGEHDENDFDTVYIDITRGDPCRHLFHELWHLILNDDENIVSEKDVIDIENALWPLCTPEQRASLAAYIPKKKRRRAK